MLGNVASLLVQQGKLADAECTQREASVLLQDAHHEQPDLEVAHAQFKLGDIQFQRGQTAVGEAAMRAGLATMESVAGVKHKRVAELCARLATLLAASKPADAEALYRTSISTFRELGNEAQACTQVVALADFLLAGDRANDAVDLLAEASAHVGDLSPTARSAAASRGCAHAARQVRSSRGRAHRSVVAHHRVRAAGPRGDGGRVGRALRGVARRSARS